MSESEAKKCPKCGGEMERGSICLQFRNEVE